MSSASIRVVASVACLVVIGASLAVASVAAAGTISSAETVDVGDHATSTYQQVQYRAAAGERNGVRLKITRHAVVVHDAGNRITAGKGCFVDASGAGRCSTPQLLSVHVALSDRTDVFQASGRVPQQHVQIRGGAGADRLTAGNACCFSLFGGSGRDVLRGKSGASLDGGAGDDTLQAGPEDSLLSGGTGRDVLRGGRGDDHLIGDDAAGPLERDVFDGGSGRDTVSYSGIRAAVFVDLRRRDAGRAGEHDRLQSIENAVGGRGPDLLIGDHRSNHLIGGGGADRLLGLSGADTLSGGRLWGGTGDDTFETFNALDDCGPGQDAVPMPIEAKELVPGHESCEWYSDPGVPVQFGRVVRLAGAQLSTLIRSVESRAVSFELSAAHPATEDALTRSRTVALAPSERKRVALPLTPRGHQYFSRRLRPVSLRTFTDAERPGQQWEWEGVSEVVRGTALDPCANVAALGGKARAAC